MPRAIPPATVGAPPGSKRCRPGSAVVATALSAGCGAPAGVDGGAAACASAADGWAQRPSALTKSSALTGPCGPRFTLAFTFGRAQSGLANKSSGLENQPPSFWSWKTSVEFLQPATAIAAAQASAIVR